MGWLVIKRNQPSSWGKRTRGSLRKDPNSDQAWGTIPDFAKERKTLAWSWHHLFVSQIVFSFVQGPQDSECTIRHLNRSLAVLAVYNKSGFLQ
ncbi:hypothetical protein ZWY2020_037235 [Hordeum vulgare]|nr:hypothetical protein ZWY2020_037235 [Hordeum vulgare]